MMSQLEIEALVEKMNEPAEAEQAEGATVKTVVFPPLADPADGQNIKSSLSHFEDIVLEICAELGQTKLKIKDLLNLQTGSVLELTKPAGEAADIYVNNQPFARGEVLVVNDMFAVRLNKILRPGCQINVLKTAEEGK